MWHLWLIVWCGLHVYSENEVEIVFAVGML